MLSFEWNEKEWCATYFLCLFAEKQVQWHEHIDVSSPFNETVSCPIWPLNIESFAVITSPSNRTDTCNACNTQIDNC